MMFEMKFSPMINHICSKSRYMSSYGVSKSLPFRSMKEQKGKRPHETRNFDQSVELFSDPAEKLDKLLDAPLYATNDKPFRPSLEQMQLVQQEVFSARKPNEVKLVEKTIDPNDAPIYNLPEIAFVGRSNVGKSSLIRALFHKIPGLDVPVSKKPGYTKALRFYQVKNFFTLVDMPGYGLNQPGYFDTCVEGFLRFRRNLVRAFHLIDATDLDRKDLEIMEQTKLPYCVVLNKIDLVGESARLKLIAEFRRMREQRKSHSCFPQPFLVSAKTGEGLAYIQAFIAHITGSLDTHR